MAARASEHPPHLDDTQSVSASRDLLLRFCTRYTGDPVAAEDLAQQTLLEAWSIAMNCATPSPTGPGCSA